MSVKFKKILIANRGEIAIRIIRTCKDLGIGTVAIHSKADENSLHVKWADESVCVGPAKSALSYLNIPAVLSAAEITEADAIHPGFGFLSENFEFSRMCEKWNLNFIGPKPECIQNMGDKILSKQIAKKAGVPILEPITIADQSEENILEKARTLGYPVIIKASAGGGGRGMCRIDKESELLKNIKRLQEEAKLAFGDGTLFIEKYIEDPRHIEVQILADKHGNIIHLGERDCTVQRRFQKVVEETPSPVLTEKKRQEICLCAVNLAKEVGYDSVGTVEFLYDQKSESFYFMEMNTRIQVEHPVTEMVTGIDLISHQIQSAQGNKLTLDQKDILFRGHSLECRVNAENPETGYPSPGLIKYYHRPAGLGIRVDDFIYTGYRVSPHYDSMLAKIISYGATREIAIKRMERALNEMVIDGITTNIDLHKRILAHPNFQGNNYSTDFLQQNLS